jgi:hypothetical protein
VLAGDRSFLPLPPGKDADDDNNNNQHPLPRFSHLPTWPTTRDTKYIRQGHGTSAIRLALMAHHVRLRQARKQASKQPQGKKTKGEGNNKRLLVSRNNHSLLGWPFLCTAGG